MSYYQEQLVARKILRAPVSSFQCEFWAHKLPSYPVIGSCIGLECEWNRDRKKRNKFISFQLSSHMHLISGTGFSTSASSSLTTTFMPTTASELQLYLAKALDVRLGTVKPGSCSRYKFWTAAMLV